MPKLELRTAQRCTVCEQLIKSQDQQDSLTEARLFGVRDPYALCPGCLQIVGDPFTLADADYRARVRVKLFERFGRVLREK